MADKAKSTDEKQEAGELYSFPAHDFAVHASSLEEAQEKLESHISDKESDNG